MNCLFIYSSLLSLLKSQIHKLNIDVGQKLNCTDLATMKFVHGHQSECNCRDCSCMHLVTTISNWQHHVNTKVTLSVFLQDFLFLEQVFTGIVHSVFMQHFSPIFELFYSTVYILAVFLHDLFCYILSARIVPLDCCQTRTSETT